ncbi:formate/nitrite transporter family protein [Halopiger aswanensis]|uniref:Formate/nitrite transporter FocA (FNT family) n=1 Tax=Halopiger aswanensis TaxID=148449 RepID=A0A419WSF3_9EURY|nr:formate/nitrite transporter family protein [Halopiger aswanensis]RKD98429.1 formate/nitrite transporter FocA (FNT family) [Halopiger aswanensis]
MSEEDEESTGEEIRESIDRAASGAPAAGWAVRDRFSADEIFERVLASADEEIAISKQRLFFSGLAAGFAIVLTFLGHSIGATMFPENSFLSAILYPIGFIYIILGQYQLYTEETLPPVALVLARIASLPLLLRVWIVVIIGNVVGAALGAYLIANGGVLDPEATQVGAEFARTGLEHGWWAVFNRALFAGWLVAGVVWLDHASRDTISRLLLIYVIFYMIAAAELFHVITAACEVFYYLFVVDGASLAVVHEFWLPVFLGNTVGGVFLVTLVNYAQVEQQRFPDIRVLSVRELLFTWRGGKGTPPSPAETEDETDKRDVREREGDRDSSSSKAGTQNLEGDE